MSFIINAALNNPVSALETGNDTEMKKMPVTGMLMSPDVARLASKLYNPFTSVNDVFQLAIFCQPTDVRETSLSSFARNPISG